MTLKEGILLSCILFLYSRGTIYKISALVLAQIIKKRGIEIPNDEISQSIKEMPKLKWLKSLF